MIWVTALLVLSFCLLRKKEKEQQESEEMKFGACAGDKVLLVTSHPDDECMFFSPTIIYLMKRKVEVNILCLSNGNYDNRGEERAYELYRSCENFGIPLGQCSISSKFKDDPKKFWDEEKVADVIEQQVKKHEIDFVITFDNYGVSGHRNHVSAYNGAVVLSGRPKQQQQKHQQPRFYRLESVGLIRKYITALDVLPTMLLSCWFGRHQTVVYNSPLGFYTGYKSMFCHETQLVWFRRLFVLFSRFMFVNTYVQI